MQTIGKLNEKDIELILRIKEKAKYNATRNRSAKLRNLFLLKSEIRNIELTPLGNSVAVLIQSCRDFERVDKMLA